MKKISWNEYNAVIKTAKAMGDDKEDFCKKYKINCDELHHLGSGDFGEAYLIGYDGDRVLKVTSSDSEFKIAKKLIGKAKQFDGFAEFFIADEINKTKFIVVEHLEEDSDVENLFYEVMSLLETQDLPIQYINHFDEDDYEKEHGKIDNDVKKFMNELEDVNHSYRLLGIEASDISAENLGRDKKGKLKAFDIEDKRK